VTDEPTPEGAPPAPDSNQARAAARRSADPRYARRYADRNLASRLFPGPSPAMSRQRTDHIDGLLSPPENRTWPPTRPDRPARTRPSGDSTRPGRTAPEEPGAAAITPASPSTPEDAAQLRETLEQQNELLRAILANSVDTQEDARSTAQNSRTFAWAGTAIALLTLIATVIALFAAIRAH
jgi:hypothetical protein